MTPSTGTPSSLFPNPSFSEHKPCGDLRPQLSGALAEPPTLYSCKTCQDVRYHKGWHSVVCRERVLPATVPDTMRPVATTKRLLDTGADDARVDHEAKRRKDDTVPMAQGTLLLFWCQAFKHPDAEAEKALKRARLLDERRAAKRAPATPEEIETMLVAAEAVLTETRETVEALTVSALQLAHAMSHRAESTAESFFQAHKDITLTTKEHARKKQLDFLESMKVYEEVYMDDVLAATPKYTARGYEEPQSDEGCFAATATIQGIRMFLANVIRDTKLLWQTAHKLSSTLKSVKENSCTCNHLKGGHQNFCRTADVWCGRCARPCSACEHLRFAGRNTRRKSWKNTV